MIRQIRREVVFSLFLFFIIILNSFFVLGLGVSPSRVTLKYIPNYKFEGEACFGIQSIGHLEVSTGGEYGDNIEFLNAEDNQFYPADQGCLKYTLKMPASIEKPGIHRTLVYATEVPDQTMGAIFAIVRVEHQIDLVVPYPGKYLEISSFQAQNMDAGGTVPITVDFINKGNETVDAARGTIFVYDNKMNVIGTLTTATAKNIEPDQARHFSVNWDSGIYKQGNYHARVEILYDDNVKANATTNFKLGGLDVDIIDYSKEIIIGGIKSFSVTADSIWSEIVHNVRATIDVYNYSNSSTQPITSFETLTRDLQPWGTDILKGYLDTTNLNLGTYDLKITLYYENLSKTYDKNLSIIKEPPPPEQKTKGKSLWKILSGIFTIKVLLIILAVLLLVTLATLVYVLVPKKRNQKKS